LIAWLGCSLFAVLSHQLLCHQDHCPPNISCHARSVSHVAWIENLQKSLRRPVSLQKKNIFVFFFLLIRTVSFCIPVAPLENNTCKESKVPECAAYPPQPPAAAGDSVFPPEFASPSSVISGIGAAPWEQRWRHASDATNDSEGGLLTPRCHVPGVDDVGINGQVDEDVGGIPSAKPPDTPGFGYGDCSSSRNLNKWSNEDFSARCRTEPILGRHHPLEPPQKCVGIVTSQHCDTRQDIRREAAFFGEGPYSFYPNRISDVTKINRSRGPEARYLPEPEHHSIPPHQPCLHGERYQSAEKMRPLFYPSNRRGVFTPEPPPLSHDPPRPLSPHQHREQPIAFKQPCYRGCEQRLRNRSCSDIMTASYHGNTSHHPGQCLEKNNNSSDVCCNPSVNPDTSQSCPETFAFRTPTVTAPPSGPRHHSCGKRSCGHVFCEVVLFSSLYKSCFQTCALKANVVRPYFFRSSGFGLLKTSARDEQRMRTTKAVIHMNTDSWNKKLMSLTFRRKSFS